MTTFIAYAEALGREVRLVKRRKAAKGCGVT